MPFNPSPPSVPVVGVKRRKAFAVVLAIELWERFGYYGMQAVLTLFMIQQLHMADSAANLMLGAFAVLTYTSPVIGGLLGDRVIGTRRTMVSGAVLLAIGYALLSISLHSQSLLLFAMALIATGNGLFKPNAGNLVRRIYEGDNAALDAAFTLYYMAVNVGSTVSMLLTPWLQLRYGASVAFATSSIGLVVGLIYYVLKSHRLNYISSALERRPISLGRIGLICLGLLFLTCLNALVLGSNGLAKICIFVSGLSLIFSWIFLYFRSEEKERAGLLLTYLLCLQGTIYLVFYQQMITSLTLFALRDVDGDFRIGGFTLWHLSAGQFQALNPIWIMVLSPLLAKLYNKQGRNGTDFSLARKMLIGYVCVACSFAIWWWAAATTHDLVSSWVMLVGYGFLSFAELLTNGLGLAIVARYTPARLSGFMMGALYLLWGIAMYTGSIIANHAAMTNDASLSIGRALYTGLFRGLCEAAVGIVFVLLCLEPLTRRWDRLHTMLSKS
ncbi:peptide MFS transporter [Swingsia samuiensis]|uniref:MFS transporter n=1 Tax=Swingsia samuiensis TaxID=1293412 RepID=A0A4Y6UHU3_9PROT|nr:oligopeptide:H+ symporter [Swingsia samuiensis]QDH17169.1 MFS transporter [Swingsia samuiensis]